MRALTSETSVRLFKMSAVIFALVGASMVIAISANGCSIARRVGVSSSIAPKIPTLSEQAAR